MRFCDFFMEYKLQEKNISKYLLWKELPKYKKVFLVNVFIFVILFLILGIIQKIAALGIVLVIYFVYLFIFNRIEYSKPNLTATINRGKQYSLKKQEQLITLLGHYNISVNDIERIDMLIKQARKAQKQTLSFCSLKRYLNLPFFTVIIAIISYVATKIADSVPIETLILIATQSILILICTISLYFIILFIFKNILSDYRKYENLIYDLTQIKIFRSSKRPPSNKD